MNIVGLYDSSFYSYKYNHHNIVLNTILWRQFWKNTVWVNLWTVWDKFGDTYEYNIRRQLEHTNNTLI